LEPDSDNTDVGNAKDALLTFQLEET